MCGTARIHHQRRRPTGHAGLAESLSGDAWTRFAQRANDAEWRREALRRFGRYPGKSAKHAQSAVQDRQST